MAVQVLRDSLLAGPTVHPHTSVVVIVPTYASGPEIVCSFSRVYNIIFWLFDFNNNIIMIQTDSENIRTLEIDNSPIDCGW